MSQPCLSPPRVPPQMPPAASHRGHLNHGFSTARVRDGVPALAPACLPRQNLVPPILFPSRGFHPSPRPLQTGDFPWAPGRCLLPSLHVSQVAEALDCKTRPPTLSSRLFLMASASPAAPPRPSLKTFGWNQMPIGQCLCCLALPSIQSSKAGASLGPSDLLWEGGQSPAKCYLFSYRGCVRPGLQPKERGPGSVAGRVREHRAAGTLELTVPKLSIIQRTILRVKEAQQPGSSCTAVWGQRCAGPQPWAISTT